MKGRDVVSLEGSRLLWSAKRKGAVRATESEARLPAGKLVFKSWRCLRDVPGLRLA